MTRMALLAVTAMVLAAVPARAQDGAVQVPDSLERVAQQAFSQLRSPITPSHTLDMCPAPEAAALRDTMRLALLRGEAPKAIVEGVIGRYGESVRMVPKRSGVGLLAWLLTPLALIGGGILVAVRLRGMRSQGPVAATASGQLSADEQARLDQALRDFDRPREDDE